MESLCNRLNVPGDFQQTEDLVAALLPWALPPSQLARESRRPLMVHTSSHPEYHQTLPDDRWSRSIRAISLYHQALRVLKFPPALHKYIADGADRPYCAWWENGDGIRKSAGLETLMLLSIMERCRAKNVGQRGEWRIVFIHVGALATLHKFPRFAERRAKRPELQFYTYGTHESVPPKDWGVREIYPCGMHPCRLRLHPLTVVLCPGGVVTFSPQALIMHTVAVVQKIRQLDEHRFWQCYILPSALGMACKRLCDAEQPLSAFERFVVVLLSIFLETNHLIDLILPSTPFSPRLKRVKLPSSAPLHATATQTIPLTG